MFTSPERRDATVFSGTNPGGSPMPQIIVLADTATEAGDGAVMLRERINTTDLESQHFSTQLLERLGWAVGDAQRAELDTTANPND
jgi:hypothetical protein